MNIKRKIFIALLLLIVSIAYAQESAILRLNKAVDSLGVNPSYSYKELSEIVKDKTIKMLQKQRQSFTSEVILIPLELSILLSTLQNRL